MSKAVPIYHLYGEDSATPSDFWLHCETIPSRSQLHHYDISAHRHEHLSQMLYVSAGQADAIIGGRSIKVSPPSVILVPVGFEHGFRFSRDIDGLVITMLSSQASLMQRELIDGPQVLSLSDDVHDAPLIATLLETIGSEAAAHQFGRSEILSASLSMALLLSLRAIKSLRGERIALREENYIEQFNHLLRQNLRAEHAAGFYAKKLGLSTTHLNRLCQSALGQTTSDYIAQMLISEIKRDLIFTNDPIQMLSFRFGFSDPAYFSRFFTRQTHNTPGKWRETERRSREPSHLAE
jgi:AraC family transcriptional activator of pobA